MRGFRSLFFGGLLGKVVGIAREILMAYAYGTSEVAAAYRVGQSAVLIPINFLTADALSAGFLPPYSRLAISDRARAATYYRFVNRLTATLAVLLCVSLAIGRTKWVALLAPGFNAGTAGLAASMLLVLALAVPAYVSTAMGSFLEMAHGRYRLASIRSSVQSIGLILGTIAALLTERPTLLAWGFTGSYFALAAWSHSRVRALALPDMSVAGYGLLDAAGQFWASIRPMLLVPILLQGSYAIERLVASLVDPAAVAAIDYARLITETAIVLVAGPLGMAVLSSHPTIQTAESRRQLQAIFGATALIFVPTSVAVAVNSNEVVALLFERGSFDQSSTALTSSILATSAITMWAQVATYVGVKALNAQSRNRAASLVVICGSAAAIATNLALHPLLGAPTLGLAISTGALVQLALVVCLHGAAMTLAYRVLVYLPTGISIVAFHYLGSAAGGSSAPLLLSGLSGALALALTVFASGRARSDLRTVRQALGRSGRAAS